MRIRFPLIIDLVQLLSSLRMGTLVGSPDVVLPLLWDSNPCISNRTMFLYTKNPVIALAVAIVATAMDSSFLKRLVKRKTGQPVGSHRLPSHRGAGVPRYTSESILSDRACRNALGAGTTVRCFFGFS